MKDGGTNSVALGWMYIDWCLRITAWRPPLPPTLAGSRWLTASDMVRIPFEMFADEERKKTLKILEDIGHQPKMLHDETVVVEEASS